MVLFRAPVEGKSQYIITDIQNVYMICHDVHEDPLGRNRIKMILTQP